MSSRDTEDGPRAVALASIVVLSVFLPLVGGASGVAAAGTTTVSSCTTVDQPGVWELSGDVTDGDEATCLRITSSDVIVDGDGHTVDGVDNDAGSNAVRIVGTSGARLSNVTVRNLDVSGWGHAINATYANDTTIEDVTVDGVSGDAILFDDAGGSVTLSRVSVENSTWAGDDGIHVSASVGGDPSQAITLRNVTLDGVDYGGIELDSFGGTQTIRDTTVNDTGGHGIEVDGKPNVTLANLSVSNTEDAGLDVSTAGSATARDVTIDETGWQGINFGSVDGSIAVKDVSVTEAGWDGISLESGYDDVTVEDVRVEGSDDWGVVVDAEINATVRNVTTVDTVDGGVELAAGDGWMDLEDVSVDDVSDGPGFSAEAELNLTARDIAVTNVTNGVGAEASASGSATLTNASVADVTTHGGLSIEAEGAGGVTMGNVSTNGTDGVGVTVEEGDLSTTGLDVEDANDTGVLVEQSSAKQAITMQDSTVNDTAGAGIELVEGATANLRTLDASNTSGDGIVIRSFGSATLEDVTVADSAGDDLNLTKATASLVNLTTSTARIDGDARGVTIDATNASQRPALPSGEDDVGSYFEASDLAADGYLNATVHYDQAAVPSGLDESTLGLWRHDSATWSEVGGTVDVSENTVSANVTSFSTFAPLGTTSSAGPSFDVIVDSTNSPVTAGETLTVDATVENVGGATGTQAVNLSIDGTERDATSVTLNASSNTTVTLSWITTTGDAGPYTATVASANDTATNSVSVHSGGGGTDWPTFGADNRNSGHVDTTGPTDSVTPRWTVSTGGPVRSSPAVVDGTVYVGSEDGNLRAIDTATGDVVLNASVGGRLRTAPTVVDGTIYLADSFTDHQNHVRALDADTGDELWNYSVGGSTVGSVAVAGDTVYVGSADSYLYAINADTGDEKWATSITASYQVGTTPAVDGGAVYAGMTGLGNGKVRTVTADTGDELWNVTVGDLVMSSPAIDLDSLYVGTGDGTVYALDTSDTFDPGTVPNQDYEPDRTRWAVDVGEHVAGSPAVADGSVYVGSFDGNVYALDTVTGTEQWNYSTGGSVVSSPAVVDDTVYVGNDDGNVYALDAQTGAVDWNYTAGGPVRSSPAVVDGTVYVGSEDGNVYALSEETPSSPSFQVSIDGTNAPVTEGDTLTVDATVENTGGMQGSQSVSLSVGGTERFTTSVTVEAGKTASMTLSWDTEDGDAGDYTVSIASENDSAVASVSVNEAEDGSGNGDDEDDSVVSAGSSGGSADSNSNVLQSISLPIHDDAPDEDGLQVRFESTPVRELSFERDVGSGQVTVEHLEDPPSTVANEFGEENVVSSVDIEVPDAAEDAPARIRFRLSESEVGDLDPDSLRIVRVVDGENQRLPTEVSEDAEDGYAVEADTPGFSTFAVVAVQQQEEPTTEEATATEPATPSDAEPSTTDEEPSTTEGPEPAETDAPTTTTETPSGQDGFGVAVALVAIVAAALYAHRRRR